MPGRVEQGIDPANTHQLTPTVWNDGIFVLAFLFLKGMRKKTQIPVFSTTLNCRDRKGL